MKSIFILTTCIVVQVFALPYYDAVVVEGRDDSEGLDTNEAFELEDCLLPPMAGPCRAGIPMFYYNSENGKCIKFRWGGCGGNANRFQSRVACERKCTGVNGLSIDRPANNKPVPIISDCQRDPAALQCRGQGCFASRDQDGCYECRCASDATSTISPTRPSNYEVCDLPPQRGHCRALLPRWTYDRASGRCKEFRFGGCDGNGNNFLTEAECQETCEGRRRRQPSAADRYDAINNDDVQQAASTQYGITQYGMTDYTSAAANFFKYLYRRFWQ